MPLSTIANLLEKNAIKRVPIVQDGKVVGIVSRADLLQALASLSKQAEVVTPDDSKIRDQLLTQLKAEPVDPAVADQRHRAGRHGRSVGHCRHRVREESGSCYGRGHPGVRADNLIIRPAQAGY